MLFLASKGTLFYIGDKIFIKYLKRFYGTTIYQKKETQIKGKGTKTIF